MTRIERRFAELRAEGRKAFVAFVMAGDPGYDASLAVIRGLPAAGVDVIEMGMPFTDPMADGPAIQRAGQRALAGGQTMDRTLRMVRAFRDGDEETPVVLMGYYNPIYARGVDRFLAEAKAAGVDGLIVVDLPPEEDEELCLPAQAAGLNFIRLATPTTDDRRLPRVLTNTSGFVYYVSITGITGAGNASAALVGPEVARIKAKTAAAGLRRLRHQDPRGGGRNRGRGGRRRGRLGHRRAHRRAAKTPIRCSPSSRRWPPAPTPEPRGDLRIGCAGPNSYGFSGLRPPAGPGIKALFIPRAIAYRRALAVLHPWRRPRHAI